jgi:ATP-dependent DNA ligase
MLAETRPQPFSEPGWLFEIKYDGFRALAAHESGRGKLLYRHGSDATALYPDLAAALAALPTDVVLDGEITVCDEQGRPSFERLQRRALLTRQPDIEHAALSLPASLFVFDLLGFRESRSCARCRSPSAKRCSAGCCPHWDRCTTWTISRRAGKRCSRRLRAWAWKA